MARHRRSQAHAAFKTPACKEQGLQLGSSPGALLLRPRGIRTQGQRLVSRVPLAQLSGRGHAEIAGAPGFQQQCLVHSLTHCSSRAWHCPGHQVLWPPVLLRVTTEKTDASPQSPVEPDVLKGEGVSCGWRDRAPRGQCPDEMRSAECLLGQEDPGSHRIWVLESQDMGSGVGWVSEALVLHPEFKEVPKHSVINLDSISVISMHRSQTAKTSAKHLNDKMSKPCIKTGPGGAEVSKCAAQGRWDTVLIGDFLLHLANSSL